MGVVGMFCVGRVGVLDVGQVLKRIVEAWDGHSCLVLGGSGHKAHHLHTHRHDAQALSY